MSLRTALASVAVLLAAASAGTHAASVAGAADDVGKGLAALMDLEDRLFTSSAAELTAMLTERRASTAEAGFVAHVVQHLEDLRGRAHTAATPISNGDIDRLIVVAEIFSVEMASPESVASIVGAAQYLKSQERAPTVADLEAIRDLLLKGAAAATGGAAPVGSGDEPGEGAGEGSGGARSRRGWWIFGNTNAKAVWKADTSKCPWVCRQGWWWESDSYGKPACCDETRKSGSPYDTCQHAQCACDAICSNCCD